MDTEHIHLDEFAHLKTFFHRFDPRAKIVSCLVLLVIAVSLKTPAGLGVALIGICLLIRGAQLPVKRILKRLGFIIPVILVVGIFLPVVKPGTPLFSVDLGFCILNFTKEGLQAGILFLLRITCAALLMILLTFTTPLHVLLHSLSDLKVPQIFTQLIQFTLRYFFVLYDEVTRMQRARRSRNFKPAKHIFSRQTLSIIGGMIGVLFIRSYERGERVYFAMMSRGFRGKIRLLDYPQIRGKDYVLALIVILLGVLSLIIDQEGWGWPAVWK